MKISYKYFFIEIGHVMHTSGFIKGIIINLLKKITPYALAVNLNLSKIVRKFGEWT